MNDEAAFLQAMQVRPEDTGLRLVFADWLEERGDPRGELIRLLHTLTQAVEIRDRTKLEDRLRSLLESGVLPVGPFWTNSLGMKFAWIPAGTFLMGSPANEEGRKDDETQHKVTLTKGLYFAIHPVTQASWRAIMRNNPSQFQGDDLPVEQVSWEECQEFLQQLSERDGDAYRLPTEAEWEYACRAGTTTPFYLGDTLSSDQANYDGNYPYGDSEKGLCRGLTILGGTFSPNGWGLYDMHGNVFDRCADWYGRYPEGNAVDPQGPHSGRYRVVRGGSFANRASVLRSANRLGSIPSNRHYDVGVRMVKNHTS